MLKQEGKSSFFLNTYLTATFYVKDIFKLKSEHEFTCLQYVRELEARENLKAPDKQRGLCRILDTE